MKFKKVTALLLSGIVGCCSCLMVAGCTGKRQNINGSMTQLYIGNHNGGMGSRWLDEYVEGFQELYKDVSFEEGKTGVEVIVTNDKDMFEPEKLKSSMASSAINVYFAERINYHELIEESLLYDITDIVTTTLPGEDESIKDKLSDSQNGYYGANGKYYGLPHYRTFRGIVYDINLFDEKGLYIKADGSYGGKSTDSDLSAGPDGDITTTYDNGLPATYDEFFKWCDYMLTKGVTPICWTGAYKETYTSHLLDALYTNIQGKDGVKLLNDLGPDDELETNLVTEFDASGNPVIQSTAISRNNVKELVKADGWYYALSFLERLVDGNNRGEKYYYKLSMNGTQSHEMTHYDFLHSNYDADMQPIAMMIEGTWWEEESNDIFESMSLTYDNASRGDRNFGFLPLPKPTADSDKTSTLYDGNNSFVFVNGNCDDVHADLAKKFIQYISTDENLQLFNQITGIARDYDFELMTEQRDSLSTFANNIYDMSKSSQIAYGYASSKERTNWLTLNAPDMYRAEINKTVYTSPVTAFRDGISAKDYFNGVWRNANK